MLNPEVRTLRRSTGEGFPGRVGVPRVMGDGTPICMVPLEKADDFWGISWKELNSWESFLGELRGAEVPIGPIQGSKT